MNTYGFTVEELDQLDDALGAAIKEAPPGEDTTNWTRLRSKVRNAAPLEHDPDGCRQAEIRDTHENPTRPHDWEITLRRHPGRSISITLSPTEAINLAVGIIRHNQAETGTTTTV